MIGPFGVRRGLDWGWFLRGFGTHGGQGLARGGRRLLGGGRLVRGPADDQVRVGVAERPAAGGGSGPDLDASLVGGQALHAPRHRLRGPAGEPDALDVGDAIGGGRALVVAAGRGVVRHVVDQWRDAAAGVDLRDHGSLRCGARAAMMVAASWAAARTAASFFRTFAWAAAAEA